VSERGAQQSEPGKHISAGGILGMPSLPQGSSHRGCPASIEPGSPRDGCRWPSEAARWSACGCPVTATTECGCPKERGIRDVGHGAGVRRRSGAVGQALEDAFCQDNFVGQAGQLRSDRFDSLGAEQLGEPFPRMILTGDLRVVG
jgi:hypothetical protein